MNSDLIGKVYGRLTVIDEGFNTKKHAYYKCRCSCGKIVAVRRNRLLDGTTKSCGCYRKEFGKRCKYPEFTSAVNVLKQIMV